MFAKDVVRKCKKDLKRTEELLQEMSVIGLIEYNWENSSRQKQYILPMFVPGCGEFMNMNKEHAQSHPEVAKLFNEMSRLPLEKVTPMVPLGGAGIGMHVIPVEKAIPTEQKSLSIEHLSHWIEKYKGRYAVGACSCRRSRRLQAVIWKMRCALESVIWRIIWWRQTKLAILMKRRSWRFLKEQRTMGWSIRLPILMERIRFLLSAIVVFVPVMRFEHPNCLILQICPGQLTLLRWMGINVWLADSVWSFVLQVR
jgi:hypothetical protein